MKVEHGLLPGQFLQRRPTGGAATVTGTSAAKGPILATVTVGRRALADYRARKVGLARGGRFRARLTHLPPGGPYTIRLTCGDASLEIGDVFVGDLWLMAGQSNMAGCARMTDAPEPHPMVRCLTLGRRWEVARDPLHLSSESPDSVHEGLGLSVDAAAALRREATHGAGLGVHFGRLMYEQTSVPQGLIATARGGTSMKQWDPAGRRRGGQSLYGSMWLSWQAAGQPLAGVLWYQGESEALPELSSGYTSGMRRLIAALRRDLGQPKLPWLTVQIGRFVKGGKWATSAWPDPGSWNDIQEQQRLLPQTIAHLAMVPAVDLELEDISHLAADAFPLLAARLANQASRLVHRDKSAGIAINPLSIKLFPHGPRHGPEIHVAFSGVEGDLQSSGAVRGFRLQAADGSELSTIYRTRVAGQRVVLSVSELPPSGATLHYGGGLNPCCNLTDSRGMAVPVFGPLAIGC